MQGKTHRVGGVLCAVAGYTLLESNGLLISGVEPLLQLAVIYPFAMYGAVVSDLDHNWNSSPSKDPVSWGINKVLHLADGKVGKNSILSIFDANHRSWQTHSDFLFFLSLILGWYCIFGYHGGINANAIILRLVSIGLILGIISHILLDALTPEGIWLMAPSIIKRKKVSFSLVPNSSFFSTGGPWERLVRSIMWVIVILLFIHILLSMSPYRLVFNF